MSKKNITLEEVREAWYGACKCGHVPDWVEDEFYLTKGDLGVFERWLNSVKAEAWDEGADFQFVNSPLPSTLDKGNNPYRTGGAE